MKLVVLGTAGYHPNDRRHTLCMIIPQCGVMLDAGTGMYRAAQWLETDELDIFLSHAHLDHVIGLTYLLDILWAHPLRRVTVHGEPDKLAAVDRHLFDEVLFPLKPPLEFCPLGKGPIALGDGGRLAWFPLAHPGGSVGYRLDWPGHSMAYVTDTTASAEASYLDHVRGVDLLVHECYFPDAYAERAKLTGHSHTTSVAELARCAGVGRLLLVHFSPLAAGDDPIGLDAARAIFPATELAADGMVAEF
jgi:ribonuclease BN (tRNA processing enzyme)